MRKNFLPNLVSFWRGPELGTELATSDIELLISGKDISNVLIDSYTSLLYSEIKDENNTQFPHIEFLQTHAWLSTETLDPKPMHDFLFEPMYKKLWKAEYLMIPMTHRSFHHTLLVLETSTKTFCHYDSMRPKRPNTGKSYEDASKMVTMINTWMKAVLNQSDKILEQEVRHVVDRDKSNNKELVLVEEQLATDDSNTIEWIMENYTSDFPLHTCKFNIPQQAPHSLDCGIYVLHYINTIVNGTDITDPFRKKDANKLRATILDKFARNAESWRSP